MNRVGRALLALAVAGSALAVGAVHTITLCAVTAVLGLSVALLWWDAEPVRARPPATLLLVVAGVLTAYTALQCVPLPLRWLAAIAPHSADVWARSLVPLREAGPSWAPVSLDPVATRVQVLRGVAYALALVGALSVARPREGLRFAGAVIVATGVVLAVAALLHPAFGAHKLFGVYEPGPGIGGRHLAPLMNPNNLAGYLNLAFCLALAAALSPDPPVPRPVPAAIALLLAGTQVWVASRGGVITMGIGAVLVVTILVIARSRRQGTVALLTLVTGVAAAAGAVLIALGGSEEAATELFDPDASKVKMFARAMHMLPAVAWLGCGRGAFESAFPAFRTDGGGHVTFAYPEDVVAQWILEWGLPVGVAGLVMVAVALRPGAMLARSTTAAGAWAALVALSVQNLADLGSEVPGLVLGATLCAAIVVAGTPGHKARWRIERWGRRPRAVAVAGAAAAAAAIALVVPGLGHELEDDQRGLHDAAVSAPPVPAARMNAMARAAMLRHPAEPYLPFAVSLRASYAGDESPVPWVGATLERATVYGPAHVVLARSLARRAPAQARLEYRLAIEQLPALLWATQTETPRLVGGYDDAMELVPAGKDGVAMLDMLVGAISGRLPATAVQLDAETAARDPARPGPAIRAAAAAVADLQAGEAAPWCSGAGRPGCVRAALEKATAAQRLAPEQCPPRAYHARARAAQGDVAGALAELEASADAVTDRVTCLKELVALAWDTGQDGRARAVIDKVASAGCSEDQQCAADLAWAAHQDEDHAAPRKALALLKRAIERAPADDALLEDAARLASQTGLHVEAAEDYEKLARRHPGEARWTRAQDAERAEAMKGVEGAP
jgi:tetratricopeptide (TPR) repeat protein